MVTAYPIFNRKAVMAYLLIWIVLILGLALNPATQDKGDLSLIVEYEETNGTVLHSFVDGELVSTNNVTLSFDFSNTSSDNDLVEFGIDLADGSDPISVDAMTNSSISIEFSNHGIYELWAFAIDDSGLRENTSIVVRIQLQVDWIESNTYEPKPLVIDPIPTNGGVAPNSILINSTVENPELIENIESGREVEFTWSLVDDVEDTCQSRNGLVHEGEFVNWETIHFNTFQVHELRISYDSGQDYLNVIHSVFIQYDSID